jgi:hypothetical protein
MFRKSELCFKGDERYNVFKPQVLNTYLSDLVQFEKNTPANSATAPTKTKVVEFLGN